MTLSIPPRPIQANASDVRPSARADTDAARQSSEPVGVVAGRRARHVRIHHVCIFNCCYRIVRLGMAPLASLRKDALPLCRQARLGCGLMPGMGISTLIT